MDAYLRPAIGNPVPSNTRNPELATLTQALVGFSLEEESLYPDIYPQPDQLDRRPSNNLRLAELHRINSSRGLSFLRLDSLLHEHQKLQEYLKFGRLFWLTRSRTEYGAIERYVFPVCAPPIFDFTRALDYPIQVDQLYNPSISALLQLDFHQNIKTKEFDDMLMNPVEVLQEIESIRYDHLDLLPRRAPNKSLRYGLPTHRIMPQELRKLRIIQECGGQILIHINEYVFAIRTLQTL